MDKVQRVIEHFNLDVAKVEDVPESFSSTVCKLTLKNGQSVYLKIPYSKGKFRLESGILKALEGHLHAPKLLDVWEGDDAVTGALLLEALDGQSLLGPIDKSIAYDIGVSHAKLHAVPLDAFNEHETLERYLPSEWRAFIQEKFSYFSQYTNILLPSNVFEKCVRFFEEQITTLPTPDGPCFVHMDFRPGNIIVRDNKVIGIIDFESVRIGSTENDFTKVSRDIWSKYPETKEPYISGYNSVRPMIDLDQLLPFYRFYDAFCSIGWGQVRGAEHHQKFIMDNRVILKEILKVE